ncbi:integrase [Rhodoblastus acidophilus]|uniref:tyrosine-type recombinase/integrase n=1 Tax=Rhodoblastus acidophilus TaxID=1074 RepID=UPI002224460D|nr:site-specific integrase [Rhodoblastus acidophilus]MCW2284720.1 integrase [Rhodoblastus acidophilus]MCW2333673.1 integrase [Rhodoblastus acidophilus]
MKFTRRIKYVVEDVDRHGNVRLYFRVKGRPKVRLPGPPESPEFQKAYADALAGKTAPKAEAAPAERHPRGSLGWLFEQYYRSPEFGNLKASTRSVRRRVLEPWAEKGGARPFSELSPVDIRRWRDAKRDTPEAANNLLKFLKVVFSWAIERGLAVSNPARDVKKFSSDSEGHHTWTVEEIRQYEARHPIGSKARLALALLLFTSQRRSDVVRLGPADVQDGFISLKQEKTGARLELPVLPQLQVILDATPCGAETFLQTEYGKPFTSNGFGNWFRDRCNEAGLPQCSAHGLRKAAVTIAAHNGATAHAKFGEASTATNKASARVLASP